MNSQVRHSQIANHPTAIDTSLDLVAVSKPIATILQRALSGKEITEQEGTALFSSSGSDVAAIAQCADIIRQRTVGDSASFVITRNINFTNICYMGCKFCGFSKGKNDADAQLLSMQEIAKRAQQAWDRGATEVCIQGGLHPDLPPEQRTGRGEMQDLTEAERTIRGALGVHIL